MTNQNICLNLGNKTTITKYVTLLELTQTKF